MNRRGRTNPISFSALRARLRQANRVAMTVGCLVLIAIMAGCASGERPPVGPLTASDGGALYRQACAACHGTDLRGTKQGPPFLDAIYRPAHHADAAFLLAVRRGVGPHHWNFGSMPAIQGLTDEQVTAIVEFVRAQQHANGID